MGFLRSRARCLILAKSALLYSVEQLGGAHAERLRESDQGRDAWLLPAALDRAHVPAGEPSPGSQHLLREAELATQMPDGFGECEEVGIWSRQGQLRKWGESSSITMR
jgi:hypothetical protein